MIAKLKAAYHLVVGHLTKVLGAVGVLLMTFDPTAVESAASAYLGADSQRKIGIGLFVLVMLRGWYTGIKAKQNANTPTP